MDAPSQTIKRAKELRRTMSLPEVLLWRELRRDRFGLRFRRQHPVGAYILDFYCDEAKLAVEVDGEGHHFGSRPVRDRIRDEWVARQGIRTLRLPARYVLKNMQDVLETIMRTANSPPQSPRIKSGVTAPPKGEHPSVSANPDPPPLGEVARRAGGGADGSSPLASLGERR